MTVYEFTDYKAFLRDYIRRLPQKGRGQLLKMAQALDVNSTLVSQVLSGPKDFTFEQGHKICVHFGFGELETEYFLGLLSIARSGTQTLKKYHQAKLEKLKSESQQLSKRVKHERVLTDSERAVFYSSWLYSAIRLACSLEEGLTVDDVVRRFSVSRERAIEILKFLTETGLCIHESGRYLMGPQRTYLEHGSPFLVRHHLNWRMKGMSRAEDISEKELMFTGPISISKKDFAALREQLAEQIKRASETVKESNPDDLACLNIDLFWVK